MTQDPILLKLLAQSGSKQIVPHYFLGAVAGAAGGTAGATAGAAGAGGAAGMGSSLTSLIGSKQSGGQKKCKTDLDCVGPNKGGMFQRMTCDFNGNCVSMKERFKQEAAPYVDAAAMSGNILQSASVPEGDVQNSAIGGVLAGMPGGLLGMTIGGLSAAYGAAQNATANEYERKMADLYNMRAKTQYGSNLGTPYMQYGGYIAQKFAQGGGDPIAGGVSQWPSDKNLPQTLPQMTVVSTNKPKGSPEYNTLDFLKNWSDSVSTPSEPNSSMTAVWDKYGSPNIEFGKVMDARRGAYLPATNTIIVQPPSEELHKQAGVAAQNTEFMNAMYDMAADKMKKYAALPKSKRKGMQGRLLEKMATDYLKEAEDMKNYSYDYWNTPSPFGFMSIPDLIPAELAHAKQLQDKGLSGMALDGLKSWAKSPYFTAVGQRRQYDIPGTQEYEAHSIIQPKIMEEEKDLRMNYGPTHKLDIPKYKRGGFPKWTIIED